MPIARPAATATAPKRSGLSEYASFDRVHAVRDISFVRSRALCAASLVRSRACVKRSFARLNTEIGERLANGVQLTTLALRRDAILDLLPQGLRLLLVLGEQIAGLVAGVGVQVLQAVGDLGALLDQVGDLLVAVVNTFLDLLDGRLEHLAQRVGELRARLLFLLSEGAGGERERDENDGGDLHC